MTSSPDGPRPLDRSDLSAKPAEGYDAWLARVRRAAVIDPELAHAERLRMSAEDQRRREAATRFSAQAANASRWLLGFLAALGVSVVLLLATGLTGWIAVACAIGSAASAAAYALARQQQRSGLAGGAPGPAPTLRQAVLVTELDESCREMLAREQRTIAEVISSEIYHERPEARQADEAALRSIEWRAAVNLRDLTLRRAQHDAIPVRGHDTAGVLEKHQRQLTAAQEAAAAQVKAIESLAARVKRAELERSDSETAIKAARLDGGYQDLEAGIAAVELAIEEIGNLADKVAPPGEAEPG